MLCYSCVDVTKGVVHSAYRNAKCIIKNFNRWNMYICSTPSYNYYKGNYIPSHNFNVIEEWLIFINFLIIAYEENPFLHIKSMN